MRKVNRIPFAAIALLSARLANAASPTELATQAKTILKTNCYRCHGERGAAEGGMAYVIDLAKLVERKKVVPGNPTGSKLFKKMASEDDPMPPLTDDDNKPITQRPSKADIALVRQWIEAGAPDEPPAIASAARAFIGDGDILLAMQKDLRAADERSRIFLRYFTITHLYNAGLSDDELQTYRGGLSKLVNSLSWGRRVVVPVAVDAYKTIFRIDLRDYKWNEETWKKILAADPYRFSHDTPAARDVASLTLCEVPYARADWFVFAASRPPLYHDVLELPATDAELEKLLKVDVAEDIRTERIARAGFNGSGVSRNNRLIERHDSPYGAYWKSYDFKRPGQNDRKNLFAHPLGPGEDARFFEQDGGEIIFNLPNGLQAYMLVNGKGQRIDKGPAEVVSDPKQEDRAVVNGVSCMSCHAKGMIEKTDQVRDTVVGNAAGYDAATVELVKALYPVKASFDAILKDDADRFIAAAEKTGAARTKSEPVVSLALRFESDLDAPLAAAEAGLTPDEFRLEVSTSTKLAMQLGALGIPGGTVQRDVFVASFEELVGRAAIRKFAQVPRGPDPAAIAALQRRADAGDRDAMYALAIRYQVANGVAADLTKAHKLLLAAADKGSAAAMLRLGEMYGNDPLNINFYRQYGVSKLGVQIDAMEAFTWFQRAAAAAAAAEGALGTAQYAACYERGEGVDKDPIRAESLFGSAYRIASARAETDPSAAFCLGLLYFKAKGTKEDPKESIAWLVKAAERGDPLAIDWAVDLVDHQQKPPNIERILDSLQRAADGGDLAAIRQLAKYVEGVDPSRSLIWHQRAADAGIYMSMMDLAYMYSEGRGVAKDERQATQWILKAATAGSSFAMIQLANRYEDGLGVAKDDDQAIVWMRKAAAHEAGDNVGPARKWLADRGLTP